MATATQIAPTAEDITSEMVEQFGVTETFLAGSGDYSQGFWHNEIVVDLEELADGNMEKAFSLIADIHDTAGTSFREYYGIDVNVKLMDGVRVESLAELCAQIWEKREQLTAGFSVEWENGNERACWTVNDDDNSVEEAEDYWCSKFEMEVQDLPCAEVYDLADHENLSFVIDALRENTDDLESMDAQAVKSLLYEIYSDNHDTLFQNYDISAERIVERIAE